MKIKKAKNVYKKFESEMQVIILFDEEFKI